MITEEQVRKVGEILGLAPSTVSLKEYLTGKVVLSGEKDLSDLWTHSTNIGVCCEREHADPPTHNITTTVNIYCDYIQGVFVNEEKRIVVTKFQDGSAESVKCSEDDEFDVAVGVALGICRHLFGHTAFYKRIVENKTVQVHSKKRKTVEQKEYNNYLNWCRDNKKRIASETTFRKNKNKYLAKMKGEK